MTGELGFRGSKECVPGRRNSTCRSVAVRENSLLPVSNSRGLDRVWVGGGKYGGMGMKRNKVTKGLSVRSRDLLCGLAGWGNVGYVSMFVLTIYLRAHIPVCPLHVHRHICRLQE